MARPLGLLPFASICQACLSLDATYRFCVKRCERDGAEFVDATSMDGSGDRPHLHRQCARCGYEWLERCGAIAPALIDAGGTGVE